MSERRSPPDGLGAAAALAGLLIPGLLVQETEEAEDEEDESGPFLSDVGMAVFCQHCSTCYVQPEDPMTWLDYCPYCGERVMPHFEETLDG